MVKFLKKHRLLSPGDFKCVFEAGKKKYVKGIIVISKPNQTEIARIGFAIGKKAVAKAVTRNQIKRVAREVFRQNQQMLAGVDYIVLVNKACLNLSKTELAIYFLKAFTHSVRQYVN